ncbi:hypothetical protein HYFRA_00013550 [Hymenoscyphus fraxineus]|uniref:Uncharacterized protein n=1 Tax=Hymenoscyphus fraxineus TaxID=746836 RepID=A0A9N9L6V1_9HELO|nr:hypothetical protein HYFRA_00013550 [Hymenoscyphus fraxineus]
MANGDWSCMQLQGETWEKRVLDSADAMHEIMVLVEKMMIRWYKLSLANTPAIRQKEEENLKIENKSDQNEGIPANKIICVKPNSIEMKPQTLPPLPGFQTRPTRLRSGKATIGKAEMPPSHLTPGKARKATRSRPTTHGPWDHGPLKFGA